MTINLSLSSYNSVTEIRVIIPLLNVASSWLLVHRIEMLQNRAACFVLNCPWRRHSHNSVCSMISTLNWKSLQTRRRNDRLILLYKITRLSLTTIYPPRHPWTLDLTTIRNCSTISQELMYTKFPSSLCTPQMEWFNYRSSFSNEPRRV